MSGSQLYPSYLICTTTLKIFEIIFNDLKVTKSIANLVEFVKKKLMILILTVTEILNVVTVTTSILYLIVSDVSKNIKYFNTYFQLSHEDFKINLFTTRLLIIYNVFYLKNLYKYEELF